MNIAYMYRIYPNSEQSKLIARTFGCVRKVYNLLLENSIKLYEQSKLGTGVFESQKPSGDYYISILFEYESNIKPIIPTPEKVIGLDYSSKSLYIDSEVNANISLYFPRSSHLYRW